MLVMFKLLHRLHLPSLTHLELDFTMMDRNPDITAVEQVVADTTSHQTHSKPQTLFFLLLSPETFRTYLYLVAASDMVRFLTIVSRRLITRNTQNFSRRRSVNTERAGQSGL
jgi:hypothetical protein